jgi:hypothetical protein
MPNYIVSSGNPIKRIAMLIPVLLALLTWSACGTSNSGTTTTTTGNAKNRAFVSNAYSGNLQIVDSQNDTTPFTAQTTNSEGQVIPGQPVTIAVGISATFEVESSDHTLTLVYDPSANTLYFVTNSTQTVAGSTPLSNSTGMAALSPDNNTVYVPEPNLPFIGQRAGGVEVITRSTFAISTSYAVPSARYLAVSPNADYLLVFADNSDSVFLINLAASPVTTVEVPGFARPVNAFFSSDGNTAYVLNCGPECGSANPASVMSFNIPSQTITNTVPVGGASVGYVNGTTLYVAGSPVPPGTTSTYDAVNIANMTRITPNSVTIGDGYHTTMALATNNKLYIGANTCSNTITGCLSVVNVSTNTADPPLPPRGAITSLMSVANRNVMYAVEGGVLHIYDTSTDQLQNTQILFSGALYGVVQVDVTQ